MKDKNFNPAIEAVVSIRHFATAASNNWSSMKALAAILEAKIEEIADMVDKYGSIETKEKWMFVLKNYLNERQFLQEIMSNTISKIKGKSTESLIEEWEKHTQHVEEIEQSYSQLKKIGEGSLPENEKENWKELWNNVFSTHQKIKNEAEVSGIQLKLIEEHNPKEVDELTDIILKHIPFNYSVEEAHQYADEYMKAYEDIKKEASQKKNLWDRFLDILAGGTQQTPAQRVIMQRWVNGEKGDLH